MIHPKIPKKDFFVGYTIDGKITVKNIGKLYYQEGIPLAIVFQGLIRNNWIPCWISLYKELIENKITHNRIIHLFNEHIFDSYGKETRDKVIEAIKFIYEKD